MPVSHKYRFIFIHIPKTAGTSIRHGLRLAGAEMDLDGRAREDTGDSLESARLHHMPAWKIRTLIGEETWRNYFKFAFVRNPWDRMVSFYHFHKERVTLPEVRNQRPGLARLFAETNSFEEWLSATINTALPCCTFICDESGRQVVDFIGRFETLSNDFSNVCSNIGLNAALPHLKCSNHQDYWRYYSETSAELVAHHFKSDIVRFGYRFRC